MKKIIIFFIFATLIIYNAIPVKAANQPIKIVVNNSLIYCEAPPIMVNGRVLVPLRTVSEALNVKVNWTPEGYTYNKITNQNIPHGRWHAFIEDGMKRIQVFPNDKIALVDLENDNKFIPITLDVPAQIINGYTFIPLRFVSENLSCKVSWEPDNNVVNIIRNNEDSAKKIAKNWLESIVTVVTDKGIGSGFLYSEKDIDGYIQVITCAHVIQDAKTITVITMNKEAYPAYVWDDYTQSEYRKPVDLARLKVYIGNNSVTTIPLEIIGDSSNVEIGDQVFILENPQGMTGRASEGIISQILYITIDQWNIKVFQTTAALSPSSSGSPVFNEDGQIIGVLFSSIIEGQNINFIIPSGYIIYT